MVDNTAYRDFSGLDTLQASNVLRRLRDRGLLEKQGAGNRTHYTMNPSSERPDAHPEQGKLPLEDGKQTAEGGKQALEGGKRSLPPLPTSLASRLPDPVKSGEPHPYPLPQAGEGVKTTPGRIHRCCVRASMPPLTPAPTPAPTLCRCACPAAPPLRAVPPPPRGLRRHRLPAPGR